MDIQQSAKQKKFIHLNIQNSEKRAELFKRELYRLKGNLQEYIDKSFEILDSCYNANDLKKKGDLSDSIQSK
jgi:hypothetical protein